MTYFFLFDQAAEYFVSIMQAVAEDNSRAATVLISGATGAVTAAINGFYAPTQEKGLSGHVVYSKCGSDDTFISHRDGRWVITDVRSKFSDECCACVYSKFSLEACGVRQWRVLDFFGGFVKQTLSIETGSDVERKVRWAQVPQSPHARSAAHKHFPCHSC